MSLTYLSSAERRARAILDAYGNRPTAWPIEERQAAQDCIAHSPALQVYLLQLADLDQRIESAQSAALPSQAEVLALQQRILDRLPIQTEVPSARTIPRRQSLLSRLVQPRPLIALTGLAAFTLVMLTLHTRPPTISPQIAGQYDAWSWYDITGQDLPAAKTKTSLTMTDLIDLELDVDGG